MTSNAAQAGAPPPQAEAPLAASGKAKAKKAAGKMDVSDAPSIEDAAEMDEDGNPIVYRDEDDEDEG